MVMLKQFFIKSVAYVFLFLIFVLPIFLFAYFVQFRLFLMLPIALYIFLFYNGIVIDEHDQVVEVEIEESNS